MTAIRPALLLAQTEVAAVTESWFVWAAEHALALTIVLIFGGALLSAVLTQWRRDKCLRLLRGDHVTVARLDRSVLWGDLIVYPKALELTFDAPFVTSRGLVKSGVLLPEADVAGVHLIARSERGLSPGEADHRRRQIRRTFRPNVFRRAIRVGRNLVNTLRDAFAKAFSAILSAVTRNPHAAALADQKSSVEGIGQQLIGAAGNAYDPMLEAHVGRPVVVQLRCPGLASPEAPEAPVSVDVPGYLVDYSETWLAVFNVDHTPMETLHLRVTPGGTAEHPGLASLEWTAENRLVLRNPGPAFLLVRSVERSDGSAAVAGDGADLDAVLPPGGRLQLGLRVGEGADTEATVWLDVTERLDLVVPRREVVVRHGGDRDEDPRREPAHRPRGLAPAEAGGNEAEAKPA